MRNFRIQFMPADTEKRRKMYCLCGSWSYSLEDVGSVPASHDALERRECARIVRVRAFLDERKNNLFDPRGHFAGPADEELGRYCGQHTIDQYIYIAK